MSLMTQEEIKEIIPHRDPFLLIDTIEEMEVGKRVVATKYMKPDEFWFKGHFPDYPVVPGVLMLEMMAQAGAVAMLAMPENKGKLGFFGGVKEAKFRRQLADTPKLYWIAIGKDDFLYKDNEAYRKALDDMGVKYEYHKSAGGCIWKTGAPI